MIGTKIEYLSKFYSKCKKGWFRTGFLFVFFIFFIKYLTDKRSWLFEWKPSELEENNVEIAQAHRSSKPIQDKSN